MNITTLERLSKNPYYTLSEKQLAELQKHRNKINKNNTNLIKHNTTFTKHDPKMKEEKSEQSQ